MAFTTPCFVRVEDPEERKKLIEWLNYVIGRTGDEYYTYGDVVLCIRDTTYCCSYEEAEFVSNDTTIDCGTNVDLFRALAAMNDENCLDQWFTDGENWGLCKDKYWAVQVAEWDVDGNDDMLEMAISPQCRKATAEEIISYFKNKENDQNTQPVTRQGVSKFRGTRIP